jgi:hypothetical protein
MILTANRCDSTLWHLATQMGDKLIWYKCLQNITGIIPKSVAFCGWISYNLRSSSLEAT